MSTLKQIIRGGHLKVSQPKGIRRVFIKGASILEMLDQTVTTPLASPGPQDGHVIEKRPSDINLAPPYLPGSAMDNKRLTKVKAQEQAHSPIRKHKRRAAAALGGENH